MSIFYDFHIHTALSPCGDDDMTPNNIVNMSVLKGLDAIAVTDHNSALNARACFECGKKAGITVLPGIEIETSEEVHLIALFDNPDNAEKMGLYISDNMPPIKNRVDIFGNQYVIDCDDNCVREIDNLLSTASLVDIHTAVRKVREFGGVVIPAHIDKSSYSIISNLGFIPEELNFSAVEIKNPENNNSVIKHHNLCDAIVLNNSDAHFLWDIHEREFKLELDTSKSSAIIDYLSQKMR